LDSFLYTTLTQYICHPSGNQQQPLWILENLAIAHHSQGRGKTYPYKNEFGEEVAVNSLIF